MKKLYFLIAALIFSSPLYSQKNSASTSTSTISGLQVLGRSIGNNCFSKEIACTHQLWADPWLNEIVLVRAHDTTSGNGIYYDLSKDGGNTWTVDYGFPYNCSHNEQVQYPSAGIIKPSGVMNPDSAYVTFRTKTLLANEIVNGQHQVNSGVAVTSIYSPLYRPVPTDYIVTRQGIIWEIEIPYDSIYFQNKIVLRRGEWNAFLQEVVFTTDTIPFPAIMLPNGISNVISSSIAFASDGLTGYIVVSGDNGTYQDSVYYPMVMKTTDGGVNWSAPLAISLSGLDNIFHLGTNAYTLFEHSDAVVDANGELHIAATVLKPAAAWSVWYAPSFGTFGIFDIYSSGPDWKARKISFPQNFHAEVGVLAKLRQFNRPQVSIDSSGTKLFFVWAETDSLTFGITNNEFPDIWMSGYDVTSGLCTPLMNVTAGTIANGISKFHQVSNYSLVTGSGFIVPVIISLLDDESMGGYSGVTFNYLSDNIVVGSAFTDSCSSVSLNATVAIRSPQLNNNSCSNVVINSSGYEVVLRLDKSWQLLRILSMQGREVFSKAGVSANYTIPNNLLSPGIYIYQMFGDDGGVCTGKFIIR